MKKLKLEKHNFNFAWGAGVEGDQLKKLVIEGVKRHQVSIGEYVRHCILKTSLEEQNK